MQVIHSQIYVVWYKGYSEPHVLLPSDDYDLGLGQSCGSVKRDKHHDLDGL